MMKQIAKPIRATNVTEAHTGNWKPGFRFWQYHFGRIYEVEGGEFVAANGGGYLPGAFKSHEQAKRALMLLA